MGIKVTEMTEATQVNNNDWLMIVQNGKILEKAMK